MEGKLMDGSARPRSFGRLVLLGGGLCAASSQVLYGPLYLLGVITPGVAAQALLAVGLAACWAVGVIGVSWLIAPYRPRTSARWLCVTAAVLTASAAVTPWSWVRVVLLCVAAAGGVVSSQALGAVRRRAPEGRGGVATGRASAVWFALIAGVPFGLAYIVAHAGVTAGLWALSALALLSAGLVAVVIDGDRLPGGRVSWPAQLRIAREPGARLVIAILVLSGGATIAGQNYAVLEAVRLGFAPQWLAPWVLLGVPAAALTPRFAARSPRPTLLVIAALAAAGFLAGAGTDLLTDSRQLRVYGVIVVFVAIQISAAAVWSAGQMIARPARAPADDDADGAIRQTAPFIGQVLIGLGLLPVWLTYGWDAICLTAVALTAASLTLLLLHTDRHAASGQPPITGAAAWVAATARAASRRWSR
jgi:hypothetical protein